MVSNCLEGRAKDYNGRQGIIVAYKVTALGISSVLAVIVKGVEWQSFPCARTICSNVPAQ